MADGEAHIATHRAGYVLLWHVRGNSGESAQEIALEMGARVDAHSLGDWEITRRPLCDACIFDLTLARDASDVFLAMVFDRPPDEVY